MKIDLTLIAQKLHEEGFESFQGVSKGLIEEMILDQFNEQLEDAVNETVDQLKQLEHSKLKPQSKDEWAEYIGAWKE